MVQGRERMGSSERERLAVVTEVWRLLARREMPGPDLVPEDATASGAVFGSPVGDVMTSLRERFRALLDADAGFGLTLREAVAAPTGAVIAVGVAHGPQAAWIIAVVNEFRDGKLVHATAFQEVAEAYEAAGLRAP